MHIDPAAVLSESALLRERAAQERFTLEQALDHARWLRKTPDGILNPIAAKRTIVALLAELEARGVAERS